MTTQEAIFFAAKVQIGDIITAGKQTMRVDEIVNSGFKGKMIYKGKDRGVTYFSFATLVNPHYCNNLKIEKA
jgi:hypothetical protein